jgi:sporulation protein YlmC with PRC-barrel domain
MTETDEDSANELKPHELRIDRLLGRQVLAANGRPVGRLEEFRAEIRDGNCVITEYVLGSAGLIERLGVAAKGVFGLPRQGYVARWDQIDFSNLEAPRLTCPVEELERIGAARRRHRKNHAA